MGSFEFSEQPGLKDSVMIAAWAGWPDAAESATRAVKELVRQLGAVKFGTLDPEDYYVFTDHRPEVFNRSGGGRGLNWPANDLYYWRPPSEHEPGVLLLVGIEPDMRWRKYTSLLAETARANGARLLITVGALLDSVPHTREPRVMGTTTYDQLGERYENVKYPRPNYEGPSGITSVTMDAFAKLDIPSVSIWGHAPHYVQVAYNPTITTAILKELQKFLQPRLDLSALETQSKEFNQNLLQALEGQKELVGYVERLEERYDSEEAARGRSEPRELMAELEDFLRQQRTDDHGEETSA